MIKPLDSRKSHRSPENQPKKGIRPPSRPPFDRSEPPQDKQPHPIDRPCRQLQTQIGSHRRRPLSSLENDDEVTVEIGNFPALPPPSTATFGQGIITKRFINGLLPPASASRNAIAHLPKRVDRACLLLIVFACLLVCDHEELSSELAVKVERVHDPNCSLDVKADRVRDPLMTRIVDRCTQ